MVDAFLTVLGGCLVLQFGSIFDPINIPLVHTAGRFWSGLATLYRCTLCLAVEMAAAQVLLTTMSEPALELAGLAALLGGLGGLVLGRGDRLRSGLAGLFVFPLPALAVAALGMAVWGGPEIVVLFVARCLQIGGLVFFAVTLLRRAM